MPSVAYVEHDHFLSVTGADGARRNVLVRRLRPLAGRSAACDLETVAHDGGRALHGAGNAGQRYGRGVETRNGGGAARPCLKLGDEPERRRRFLTAKKHKNELRTKQPDAPLLGAYGKWYPAAPSASEGEAEGRGRQDKGYHGLRLAAAEGQSVSAASIMRLAARLKGYVVLTDPPTASVKCGGKVQGDECGCHIPCPLDKSGNASTASVGPSAGDPVNLATLEEQYEPGADLNVYNPIGPSVSFSRIYNSLRPAGTTYPSDDLGVGWSHNYNYLMYDPTTRPLNRYQQGSSNSQISSQGNDAPGSGLSWDIVQNGVTIATSTTTNGWSAGSQQNYISLTIPSNAPVGTDYHEVRLKSYGSTFISTYFDVYASTSTPQAPAGGTASFYFTGHDSPAAGLTWDIIQGSTTIATSSSPNQWSVSPGSVSPPLMAALGTYEVRYNYSSGISSYFQVYAVDYNPKAGTRYLIEPNGAQVAVTAYAVPTATNPTVACVLPAGYPMMVTWNYAAGYTCGYYDITFANREQIVTTTTAKVDGSGTAIYMPNWTDTGSER